MRIYNINNLEKDIQSGKINYIVRQYEEIQEEERNIITNEELGFAHAKRIQLLKTNFSEKLEPIKNCYPKTYAFLKKQSIEYEVFFRWSDMRSKNPKHTLFSECYFILNKRIYHVTPKSSNNFNLPSYLQTWRESIGGIVCSDNWNSENGSMLIDDAWSWHSFDDYVVKQRKKTIQEIVNKIPNTYVAWRRKDRNKDENNLKDRFPNLRCFLDTRMPFDSPEDVDNCKEYDLLFVCYQFNETVYLVRNGDFINEFYTIVNPAEALDNYLLHVFSQHDQEFIRFDFSPWMKKL